MRKKLPFCGIVLFLFCLHTSHLFGQLNTKIKTRGAISNASENVNNEPDPLLNLSIKKRGIPVQNLPLNSTTKPLSAIPNGMEAVAKATDRFIGNEYKFTLLSSHKYMINDCLGIKVSAGEFDLRFKNPHIGVDENGSIKIKLSVDRLLLNGIKIRMKPRAPDFSDPNPCHFSGKFEIGGEAKDLSVTILINPMVVYYPSTPGNPLNMCLLGDPDFADIDWVVNSLNFFDLLNTLDQAAREMLYDGLEFTLHNLIFGKFIDLLRSALEEYYKGCESAIWTTLYTMWDVGDANEEGATSLIPNNLKTSTGRLMFNNPAGSVWTIYIYRMSDNKYVTSYANVNNKGVISLAPGNYKITLNDAPVLNVQIKKGHDTELKTGVLEVDFDGVWYLYKEDRSDTYTSGNKPTKLLLPVGRYLLEEGGQTRIAEVKEPKKTR